MDETHLSEFNSVSNHAHRKRSRNSLFCGSVCFQLIFFSQTRDCTTFTLHDLTDFYVERVTAHRIKINGHSCFHNSWPNSKTFNNIKIKTSLRERGPPGVSGALRSLRILRIGRIGSATITVWTKRLKHSTKYLCVSQKSYRFGTTRVNDTIFIFWWIS